jgi:hypothetical protein
MLGLVNEPLPGQPLRASDTAAVIRYLRNATPRSTPGSLIITGSGGSTRRPIRRRPYAWPLTGPLAWPFKVYDASSSDGYYLRVNSGDGQSPGINSQPALIDGTNLTNPIPPDTAPLLDASTIGDGSPGGYVYVKVWLVTSGVHFGGLDSTGGGGTGVDVIFSNTALPAIDPDMTYSVPATYAQQLIATANKSGSRLIVENTTITGWSTFNLCGFLPQFD